MGENSVILLKRVSYRENVILMEFNRDMNININNINVEQSFLKFINYAIEREGKLYPFPYGTKVIQVEFGFSVQFVLPKSFLENIHDNAILHLGYIERRKIFYIQSAEGFIPDVCRINLLGTEIELLDLNNGTIQIVDEKTLRCSYKGENRFYRLAKRDFYVDKENVKYYSKAIKKINDKEFILSFNENIFKRTYGSISLNINDRPISEDIYGFKIKGNLQIDLIELMGTYIKSFSFCDYNEESKIGHFKLYFSNSVNFFSSDFKAKINNNSLLDVIAKKANSDKTIIDINVENLSINNVYDSIIEFFTFVDFNSIETIDGDGKKVFIKSPVRATIFRSLDINWILRDYNFSKSVIIIEFSKPIIPKCLITDYSVFNTSINSWNGEKLSIKPGNLIIEYEKNTITNENLLTLKINKNESFGKITIKEKLDFTPIDENKILNTKCCYIYVEDNRLFLEFDEKEDMDGILVFIKQIKYYPYDEIQNTDGNFIFYGYRPVGTYSVDDNIIYVEPLKDISENPFKGESILGNYILGIHNNNKIRDYGDDLNATEINGFLRIVGRLEEGEIATLKNLNVLGTIITDSSRTNINIDKVECFGDAEFKTR